MGKLRLTAAVTASGLLAALALAACGGSSDNGSSADESQITQAITAAATSGDPSACTKYQTLKFTEQTSGGQGQAAVRSCEKSAKDTAADKIDVSDIEVNGDSATAKGDATGGTFNGQTVVVSLVKQNGQWKLDEFKGFEDFNKDAMISSFKTELQKEGASPQAISCLEQQFQNASDQQIEDTFTGNNPQGENQLFGPCAKFFQGQ